MQTSTAPQDFVQLTITRWREAIKSLGGSEIDERQAFTTQILERLLGYEHTKGDYQVEERGTYADIAVYDKQHNKVLVIETKRSDKTIDNEETEDQAFGYSETFTRYVATCNLKKFKLYQNANDRPLIAQVDFHTILTRGRTLDGLRRELLASEYAAIDRLRFISKEEIWDDTIFENFDEGYHASDVVDSERFSDLIGTLEKCVSYLFGYALRAFSEYENRLSYYDESVAALEKELESAISVKDQELEYKLRFQLDELRRTYQNYIDFRNGLDVWKATSQRTYSKNDEYREAFCREAAYVLLNKVLFIRVCEDKQLLPKKISNGGIASWKAFTEFLKENYKDLLAIAYSDASHLYDHIYRKGIFDWYQFGNSELNDILKRIFWNLNHFDFANVDKDILGRIYERYLSPDQRKALGEFYTPPEIVRYILDAVEYKSQNEKIRGVQLIDLGCGSGGFLVEALNRVMASCQVAGVPNKKALQVAIEGIHGFDIDHFAVHICEMNLAFRLVDTYRLAKSEDAKFVLSRLNIFQTNSLRLPQPVRQARLYSAESLYQYMRELEEVDRLKQEKYLFVVGNPPYVTKQLTKQDRDYYLETYRRSISNRFNLYRLFIHRASMMLEEGGMLGFIVPNTWIADTYASAFRLFLRENFRIKRVVPLPEKARAFYKVTQATTILILQKDTKDKENYAFELASEDVDDISKLDNVVFKDRSINDVAFGEQDAYKFVLSPYDNTYTFIKKMRDDAEFLGTIVEDIQSGEIRQVEVRNDLRKTPIQGSYSVIHGDNTDAFFIDTSQTRRDAMYYVPPTKRLLRDDHSLRDRIVLQRISNMTQKKRIKAAYLEKQQTPVYVENGANYILLNAEKTEYSPNYLVGLLNSSALNQYFRLFSSNNNVQPSELKRLPIKRPTEKNKKTIAAICDAVSDITLQKLDLTKAEEIVKAPSVLNKEVQSIYSASIRKYPAPQLKGSIQLRRDRNKVWVSVADYFECEDEIQAKCIEILVSHLADLSELAELKVPKTKEQCEEFVKTYELAKRNVITLPSSILELEKKMDRLTCTLYELSPEEIDLIENRMLGFTEPVSDASEDETAGAKENKTAF